MKPRAHARARPWPCGTLASVQATFLLASVVTTDALKKTFARYQNSSAKYVAEGAQDGQAYPCYYINLAGRVDRREQFESEVTRVGLQCERIEAIDAQQAGITPAEACRQSHLLALNRFDESGKPFGLILEDDMMWYDEDSTVKQMLRQLPEATRNHPVTFLSCGNGQARFEDLRGSAEVAWLAAVLDPGCQTSSAYFVRKDYVGVLENQGMDVTPFDIRWKRLQQRDHWAMTSPLVVKQRADWSDIERRFVDYGVFHQKA